MVRRDFGFAPNPFFSVCTLATCKPSIRRYAQIGDWVVGTGSAKNSKTGYLVFAMKVTNMLSYNDYWIHPEFQNKKPNLRGSIKQAYGDNIYHKNRSWHQADSHHSHEDGSPNHSNIDNDTQTDRMLISEHYVYFGGDGPLIPSRFRNYKGIDICATRGYKNKFQTNLISDFIDWIYSLSEMGYVGPPIDWK